MPVTVYGPGWAEVNPSTDPNGYATPSAATFCNPRFIEEVLINTPMFLYVQETCPVVQVSPTGRCTDNRRTWQPLNGVTNEAQNERQIAGAAELVSNNPSTPDTFGEGVVTSNIFNGKDWLRNVRTYVYTIAFNENDEEPSAELVTTGVTITDIRDAAQTVTNNDASISYLDIRDDTATLANPANNPFGLQGADLIKYTKLKNAFGNSGSSFLPQLAFSTADLAPTILLNGPETPFASSTGFSEYLTEEPFTFDEATRIELTTGVSSDDPETVNLVLTQMCGAVCEGDLRRG
jgi:hypothetical protein